MRAETLGLSIAGHAVLGLVLASLATHERPAPPATVTTIEMVDAPSPPPPVDVTTPTPTAKIAASTGGRTRLRAPTLARATAYDDPRGEIHVEGGHGGDDTGGGAGFGGGRGQGIGLGDGARITVETLALKTPPAPAASKARTARLVYPVREREVDDSELFIARVTIDDEGFVVGAKLVRGFGGPRDAQAADLIWKFRYAPALDDDGRAIRSTFDQRFLVGR